MQSASQQKVTKQSQNIQKSNKVNKYNNKSQVYNKSYSKNNQIQQQTKDNLTQSNIFENQRSQQKLEQKIGQKQLQQKDNQNNQYWEFSAYNVQKSYNKVLQYLNKKHLQLENVSNKQIVKQLQEKLGKDFWITIFQAFKFFVQKKFNFIFVQENEKFSIAHIQFMHSNIIKSFKQKDDKPFNPDYSLKVARKYTYMSQQKNQSLSINLLTGEFITQFIKAPLTFGNSEYQQFLSVIMQAIQDSRKGFKYIKLIGQPLGLQIQAKYHNNEWFLSTRSSLRVNELKCRSEFTLYQTFIQLLQSYNVSIDDLDKKCIYTFQIVSSNYTPLPVINQIYLISIFDTINKASAKDDPLKSSNLPKLPKLNIDLDGDFYTKKQTIYDAIGALLTQYSIQSPIFSILIKINNQFYEIQSEVANTFYLLTDKLSQYKNQDLNTQQYQEIIEQELKSLYESPQNNNYLKFIINQKKDDVDVKSQ